MWGAKYVARHPNLVAIDLSSFKCGHDAPIYNTVENIIEASGTPYFTFHDIDENKPTGSIKIRVETIDYFLQRYQEHLQRQMHSEEELEQMVAAYRAHLQRASTKAAMKLGLEAGHIEIGGNDSSHSSGSREHEVDELGAPHHGQDSWVPVTLDIGKNGGNGNGHSPNGKSGDKDSDAYDRIRAQNTANDNPEDEMVSGSASCNLPGQDHPKKAYAQLLSFQGNGAEEGENGHDDNMIKLVDIELPRRKRVEEPVEAD